MCVGVSFLAVMDFSVLERETEERERDRGEREREERERERRERERETEERKGFLRYKLSKTIRKQRQHCRLKQTGEKPRENLRRREGRRRGRRENEGRISPPCVRALDKKMKLS